MDNKASKWVRGAIPALLLHCSIGTVYCWSIFSQEIANYIGWSKGATEWAFSLLFSSLECQQHLWETLLKRTFISHR